MKKNLFALCAMSLLLSGCSSISIDQFINDLNSADNQTEQDVASTLTLGKVVNVQAEKNLRERYAELPGLLREVCDDKDFAPYYAKTACLVHRITPAQLTDKSRVTPSEAKAAQGVFEAIAEMNKETRAAMRATENPRLMSVADRMDRVYDPRVERMQKALVDGSITWGEYNRQRLAVSKELSRINEALKKPH